MSGTWHTVALDRGDVGVRIDRVLLRHLQHIPGVTRNRLQRLIAGGHVHVNGLPVARAASRLASGDEVSIELPARRPRNLAQAESLPIEVYEDDQLLIVNKPAGQVSHPAFRHPSGTLLNGLLAYAGAAWKPALVGRLDKGTSGLVLVAKDAAVHAALQRLGDRNRIEKDYLAIVHGRPPARGTIDQALDRDPWDHRRVTVRDRGGIPSVTTFTRLKTVRVSPRAELSLVRCRLVTGRMHQIRVHLAAGGWPIVGDRVYGRLALDTLASTVSISRQALHAWRLAFDHPITGVRLEVRAPVPPDMASLVDTSEIV
jgi:23S rRNA pseudouridine1911/1915/1917 synthase